MNDSDAFYKQPTLPIVSENESVSQQITIPKMIGPYKIESLLERGGMSILYLGTHPETKEPVTIKVLSPKYLANPEVVKRFLNEAEIIALADHPNIVKLYGHGEWEEGLYIAMEFVQGISLRQFLLQTPMSLKKSLEIIIDIGYALCHLHTHGVIHRDLKPENILMTETGHIKVIDFGISQLLTEKNEHSASLKKRLIGTPIYMSPEQRENPETVSYPSDIYSLGIIAYELVLGKLSHGQIHISLMPKGLQKIMNKALQYKPEDRYLDIVDFISDVTSYLHSSDIQKEMKVGDQLSELSENLKQAYHLLIPSSNPVWPHLSIGIVSNKSMGITGYFYDFFQIQEDSYGIILGESFAKGAEGILNIAYLKGMVRALCNLKKKPAELAITLNEIILKDHIEQAFSMSYAILSPKTNELNFISCGLGHLWQLSPASNTFSEISTNNIALGLDLNAKYVEVNRSWPEENVLLFCHASLPSLISKENIFSEGMLKQILQENMHAGPQKIVEYLHRKIRLSSNAQIKDHPYTIICIQRKTQQLWVSANHLENSD
jgi:eukaryotic-like serine/threonine-protein kinase